MCRNHNCSETMQELATHIGEVVINKCFCTRRNPISISAAAIYLACQLEDKRKTQAEICKVTGLTEVTLRKVYKELLENWDDLLPSNYNPVVPPEKAFPMATIASGRSSGSRSDLAELPSSDRDRMPENKPSKPIEALDTFQQASGKDETDNKDCIFRNHSHAMQGAMYFQKSQIAVGSSATGTSENNHSTIQNMEIDSGPNPPEEKHTGSFAASALRPLQYSTTTSTANSISWAFQSPASSKASAQFMKVASSSVDDKIKQNESEREKS